jgi:hypothetical protein
VSIRDFTELFPLNPRLMTDLKQLEVWFVTGSQHLYGLEALKTEVLVSCTLRGYKM